MASSDDERGVRGAHQAAHVWRAVSRALDRAAHDLVGRRERQLLVRVEREQDRAAERRVDVLRGVAEAQCVQHERRAEVTSRSMQSQRR